MKPASLSVESNSKTLLKHLTKIDLIKDRHNGEIKEKERSCYAQLSKVDGVIVSDKKSKRKFKEDQLLFDDSKSSVIPEVQVDINSRHLSKNSNSKFENYVNDDKIASGSIEKTISKEKKKRQSLVEESKNEGSEVDKPKRKHRIDRSNSPLPSSKKNAEHSLDLDRHQRRSQLSGEGNTRSSKYGDYTSDGETDAPKSRKKLNREGNRAERKQSKRTRLVFEDGEVSSPDISKYDRSGREEKASDHFSSRRSLNSKPDPTSRHSKKLRNTSIERYATFIHFLSSKYSALYDLATQMIPWLCSILFL